MNSNENLLRNLMRRKHKFRFSDIGSLLINFPKENISIKFINLCNSQVTEIRKRAGSFDKKLKLFSEK